MMNKWRCEISLMNQTQANRLQERCEGVSNRVLRKKAWRGCLFISLDNLLRCGWSQDKVIKKEVRPPGYSNPIASSRSRGMHATSLTTHAVMYKGGQSIDRTNVISPPLSPRLSSLWQRPYYRWKKVSRFKTA